MPKKPCAHPGCSRLVDLGSAYCEAHAAQDKRDRDRTADAKRASLPYRKWYKRKAWCGPDGRRARQLADEPLCALCPEHSKQLATIADHVVPHNGDHGLFWFGELQSLCKPCHDIKKQRLERRAGRGKRWGWSIPDGLKASAIPVVLVCGPPAAGKSTYVDSQRHADDLVIDMDHYLGRVGGAKWGTDRRTVAMAFKLRDAALHSLSVARGGRAWLPVTAAEPEERAAWLAALGRLASVVVIAPPMAKVLDQMENDPRRDARRVEMKREIVRWYQLNGGDQKSTAHGRGTGEGNQIFACESLGGGVLWLHRYQIWIG